MTTKAGVGMSLNHSPINAGHEAGEKALKKAGVNGPDFVFMFASAGYDQHSLLRAVRDTTRGAPSPDVRGEARSAATKRTNRTSPWSSWPSPRTSCGGPTG